MTGEHHLALRGRDPGAQGGSCPGGGSELEQPPAPRDPLGFKPVVLVPENAKAGKGGFPLQVAPDQGQSLWIEIYTRRDLPPGLYEGEVAVGADGRFVKLPVELEVLDLTLPDENSLRTMVYFEPDQPELYQGRNLDPAYHRFAWGVFDAAEAHRMRWFLRGGWGSLAHYGTGDIVMHEPRAGLLVPCLVPADLQATITLQAPERRRLRAFVNGRPAGPLSAGPDPVHNSLGIPAGALFRGDNVLAIAAAGDDWGGVALRRFTLGPAR